MNTRKVGDTGEQMAADFLRQRGYRVLGQNVHARGGELDLICEKGRDLIFIEVKLRKGKQFGDVRESITFTKLQRLQRAIWSYLVKNNWQQRDWQLDFLGIEITDSVPEFIHIENIGGDL